MANKELQPIRIVVPGELYGTQVIVGGTPLKRVRKIMFEHDVDKAPVLHLEIICVDGLEIEGEALLDTTAVGDIWRSFEKVSAKQNG